MMEKNSDSLNGQFFERNFKKNSMIIDKMSKTSNEINSGIRMKIGANSRVTRPD
jgi:hypothetical protein